MRTYSVADVTNVILKRRWLILAPFAVGVALTPVLARYAPERYRSQALIVVMPQQVPDSFVKSTITETVQDRLPAITNRVMSQTQLRQIIEQLDMYKAERLRNVMEDVVETMKRDVSTTAMDKTVDSFTVSYVSDDPKKAHDVTEKLVGLYIDQNTADRENLAVHTNEFLDTQLADKKRRLIELDKKLEEYQKSHAGQMPEQLQGNLQAIQNANMQLQALSESTNRAQQSRLLIERQLADATAQAGAAAQMGAREANVPPTTAQLLDAAQAKKTALLQRFTPDYPEVVQLDRQIATLTRQVELESPLTAPDRPLSPVDAAQQKKVEGLQADLAVLDYQLDLNRVEAEKLKKTIAAYTAKVDAVPTRQSELVELTRDYSTLQAAYSNLLMKSEDSMIAANLERRKIGETFRLVDEASRPERPYNQRQRLMTMASGAAGGLALGLLIVAFLEIRDSSFKSAEEVLAALSVPVLASIPMMKSDRERRSGRWRTWLFDVAGTALLVAAGAVLVLWRLRS